MENINIHGPLGGKWQKNWYMKEKFEKVENWYMKEKFDCKDIKIYVI